MNQDILRKLSVITEEEQKHRGGLTDERNRLKKLQHKLDLVIDKLMHLGGSENEEELKEGGESIGFFRRDFGIQEWDWPQGVGLYGLYQIMESQQREDYRESLYHCFKDNMAQGLPSKNINTTTPLLTLAYLNVISQKDK